MDTAASLIAEIVADPESTHAWDVYSDWLLDRGDPRGAWIRAALASDDDNVATKPPVDETQLLSPRLAEHEHLLRLRWWRGFIRGASLTGAMDDPPTFDTIHALFADPHAALLASIKLDHPITETVPLWQALIAEARPSITRFSATYLGRGGSQLHALVRLERLEIIGRRTGAVDELAHPTVRTLVAEPIGCPALITGRFELPELEHLEYCGLPQLAESQSILQRPPPKLRTLSLGGSREAIEMLAACRGLRQLRRVALESSFHADVAFAALRDHASAFRHLDQVETRGGTTLQREQVDALRAEVQRTLPTTNLDIAWDHVAAPSAAPPEPDRPVVRVDADSRDEHGRVNAVARFSQHDRG